MKLKNAVDKQVVVKGYAVEVDSTDDGQITLGLPGNRHNYVVPEGYVCVTLNDDNGDEFYIIAHKNTPAGEDD